MEKKFYNTRQRDIMLSFFKNHSQECFTAKQLIETAGLNIGEATIYRCLAKLSDSGQINKFISQNGESAYYQYNSCENCSEHFHLKCLQCGATMHMDCEFMKDVQLHLQNSHNFYIDNKKTVIYGICKQCKD